MINYSIHIQKQLLQPITTTLAEAFTLLRKKSDWKMFFKYAKW
jgi:hypothetical protein